MNHDEETRIKQREEGSHPSEEILGWIVGFIVLGVVLGFGIYSILNPCT